MKFREHTNRVNACQSSQVLVISLAGCHQEEKLAFS